MAETEFPVRDTINTSQSAGSTSNNTQSRDTGSDSDFRFYEESTYSDEYFNLNDSTRETYDNMDRETRNRLERKILSSPSVYQYPSDLQNHPEEAELVHSVIFRILARTNSRVGQIAQRNGKSSAPLTNTEENRVTGETGKEYLTTLGGVAAGIAGYKALTNPQNNIFGKVAVGATVGVAGGLAANLLVENVSTVRLDTAIELYVTQPPIAQYSAEWENKEIGALGGIVARGETPEFSKQGFLKGAVGLGELAVRGIIGAAASIPSSLGLTGDLAAGIEATTRKVANPYKEQLFKSMGFRQFAFSYKFAPRNKSELEAVMEIIQQFKYHMHPENDSTNLFLEYPSEFEIEYRYRGSRNTYLSRISTCALTDMKITYGGQDAFTSFIDTQGAPSEINMELAFQELETLTNDRIGLDYKDSL